MKGVTGLSLDFGVESNITFSANVGPFKAEVTAYNVVDNNDSPMSIVFGLDQSLNYFLEKNKSWVRDGFTTVNGVGSLADALDVSIAGRVKGTVNAVLAEGFGSAYISSKFFCCTFLFGPFTFSVLSKHISPSKLINNYIQVDIADINNILQNKANAVAVVYRANVVSAKIPSFIDLLLLDPEAIVDAVGNVFDQAEKFSVGSQGVVSTLDLPFVKGQVAKRLNASTPENPIRKAKRNVVGAMEARLKAYDENDSDSNTVADIIAAELDIVLSKIGILDETSSGVDVTYYVHPKGGGRVECIYGEQVEIEGANVACDPDNIKSLMWTIPFGQEFPIELPELDFELPEGLPVQLKVDSETPVLELFWKFKLAFGFDETDGFFLYTFPEDDEDSEFQVVASLDHNITDIDATLLYFLNLGLDSTRLQFGAGLFVDIDKEKALRLKEPDDATSFRYGRVSRDDLRKVPNKKDLFQISAVAAATLDVDEFLATLRLSTPDFDKIAPWIPTLNGTIAAMVRKELGGGAAGATRRGRRHLRDNDHETLKRRISTSDHQGLRLLVEDSEYIPYNEDCPVNSDSGEIACFAMYNIELDVGKIADLVRPILEKFVNNDTSGYFDNVAAPLLELNKELPGISDMAGKSITALDVAEASITALLFSL